MLAPIMSTGVPEPESSRSVPTERLAGSIFHSEAADSEPFASNTIVAARSPTSCDPARVKMLIWLWSLSTTLMSISCDELVDVEVALVRSVAVVASCTLVRPSC